jgi:hypothetical protein
MKIIKIICILLITPLFIDFWLGERLGFTNFENTILIIMFLIGVIVYDLKIIRTEK